MFIINNPELETKLNRLLKEYNLIDIVAYLSSYLENQSSSARTDNLERAEILYNASGFCIMLLSELERLPATERI